MQCITEFLFKNARKPYSGQGSVLDPAGAGGAYSFLRGSDH